MIVLDKVAKSFQSEKVINGISITINDGDTAIMIGPSGCGKSTLLKLMLGLILPDSGRITCFGEEIRKQNVYNIRNRIGYVIQQGGLFPNLTAGENIIIMARQAKWSAQNIERRLGELSELTSFESRHLKHYPVQLSGGQRQRVALMRALMLDPEILFLDEPLGALDPMIRYDLQVDLRKIFKELGKTTVMVTHDLAEADYFSENVLLMREGRIVQRGSIAEISENPVDKFVTRFINAQRKITEGA